MGFMFTKFRYRQSSIDYIDPAIVSELARHLDSSQLRLLDFSSTLNLKRVVFQTTELLSFSNTCLKELLLKVIKLLLCGDICIQEALGKLSSFREAISFLDRGTRLSGKKRGWKMRKNIHTEILRRWREFRFEDTPFRDVDSTCRKLKTMVAELKQRKGMLEARLSSNRSWRKACEALYTAGIITVLLGSVVPAVVASPPAAIAGATALASAMKPAEAWWRSTWDERERLLEEEKEVVQIMRSAFVVDLNELEMVSLIVDKLKIDVDYWRDATYIVLGSGGEEEEAADIIGMKRLEKTIVEVETGLASLKEKVDVCTDGIKKTATIFLKAISK